MTVNLPMHDQVPHDYLDLASQADVLSASLRAEKSRIGQHQHALRKLPSAETLWILRSSMLLVILLLTWQQAMADQSASKLWNFVARLWMISVAGIG